jgi:hypothetical protein
MQPITPPRYNLQRGSPLSSGSRSGWSRIAKEDSNLATYFIAQGLKFNQASKPLFLCSVASSAFPPHPACFRYAPAPLNGAHSLRSKKRGSRWQPPPPCHRTTKPAKPSRRRPGHRPTLGALKPPQVASMCLLGRQRLAQPSNHRGTEIPSGQQRLC